MRNVSLICLFCLLIFGCVTSNIESDSQESNFYDDEKLAIVNDTLYLKILAVEEIEFWIPTNQEIEQVDDIYLDAIKNNDFDFLKEPKFTNIKNYYRQYLCFNNDDKEKMVYVYAFCDIPKRSSMDHEMESEGWKSHIISVYEGGPCYWKMKINLTQTKYLDVTVNGY